MAEVLEPTHRISRVASASATAATAQSVPVLPYNPRRISWSVSNTGANAGRLARRPGIVTTANGVPLSGNDGFIGESFRDVGSAVQDPVFILMATGDQDVYVEEVELRA